MIIIARIPFVTKNMIVMPMAIQKNIKPIILFMWLQINSYYCIVILYVVGIKCSIIKRNLINKKITEIII